MDSKRYERIVRTAQGKFPIELEDDFEKNLARIETEDKVYYARKVNDILKDIEDYYWVTIDGKVWSTNKGNFLIGWNREYTTYGLRTINGETQYYGLHRLVQIMFDYIDDYNDKNVNHLDGNTHNNNPDNLEWTTYSGNLRHARENGLHSLDVLSIKDVEKICELIEQGERNMHIINYDDIESDTLSMGTVNHIRRNDYYKALTKEYDLDTPIHDVMRYSIKEMEEIAEYIKNSINERRVLTKEDIRDKFDMSVPTYRKVKMYMIENNLITKEESVYVVDNSDNDLFLVEDICEELSRGERVNHIADKLNIKRYRVHNVKHRNLSIAKFIMDKYEFKEPHPFADYNIDELQRINEEINSMDGSYGIVKKTRDKLDITKSSFRKLIDWFKDNKEKYEWIE